MCLNLKNISHEKDSPNKKKADELAFYLVGEGTMLVFLYSSIG